MTGHSPDQGQQGDHPGAELGGHFRAPPYPSRSSRRLPLTISGQHLPSKTLLSRALPFVGTTAALRGTSRWPLALVWRTQTDLMAKQLLGMAIDPDVSDAVKLSATKDALDRGGSLVCVALPGRLRNARDACLGNPRREVRSPWTHSCPYCRGVSSPYNSSGRRGANGVTSRSNSSQ